MANTGKMSGTKRKNVVTPGTQPKGSTKKQKTAPGSASKPQIRAHDLETATDSDPIVESDTTEHSGDDDGASWPSDEGGEDEVSKVDGPNEGVPLPGHKPQKVGKTGAVAKESSGNQSRSPIGAMVRVKR